MIDFLKDSDLSARLERDGYVVVSLCSAEQIEQLKGLFQQVPADENSPFWSSSFLADADFKKELSDSVSEVLGASLDELLSDYKQLGCSFLVKQPGEYSAMPIHQDWTVVDESKYGSFTFWMPLQDTTTKNGCLQVIPSSHKLNSQLRSPSLPVDFEGIRKELRAYLVDVTLKAGEAMLFNHALMHSSPANLSQEPRVAVTFGLVPKVADMFMYYGTEDGKVKKYNMPDDMFIKYPEIRNEPLIGEFAEEFEYQVKDLTMEEVEKQLGKPKSQMVPLFKDPELQEHFEKNGFVKIPALEQEQVDQLITLHKELNLKDEKGYGFHVGMDNADKALVTNMVNRIKEVAMPKVEGNLTGAQVFTASFVIKEPNPQGVVPPHQDWSFVEDEKKHCSVTCWIPLQDVNMDNGCIGVIRGSNRFFSNVRPSPSPQVETPLKNHMYTIFPYLELLEMKAGEALIFDNRTFHASPPNTTDSARLAVGLGFTQAEAEIRHYYLKPGTDDTLLKYKIDPEFFLKYDNLGLSKMYDAGKNIEGYELLGEMKYEWENLSDAEMRELIESAGNKFNGPLVETMTKLFVQQPQEEEKQPEPEPVVESQPEPVSNGDGRTFWETYTPMNIIREVKFRLTGKA
ncbi:MAG: phytanoyl-CoA dioxygenase family protein [Flavobacteriales bacterium]|nr:phytanoyl-CoA dioxygenase family protein [Flavobacteriales bacterium]MCB9204200.1 phytanoyl-CoA dioxygenase family protein [Flavobacteriales bacterium]